MQAHHESIAAAVYAKYESDLAYERALHDMRAAYPTMQDAEGDRLVIYAAILAGSPPDALFDQWYRNNIGLPQHNTKANRSRMNKITYKVTQYCSQLIRAAYKDAPLPLPAHAHAQAPLRAIEPAEEAEEASDSDDEN